MRSNCNNAGSELTFTIVLQKFFELFRNLRTLRNIMAIQSKAQHSRPIAADVLVDFFSQSRLEKPDLLHSRGTTDPDIKPAPFKTHGLANIGQGFSHNLRPETPYFPAQELVR